MQTEREGQRQELQIPDLSSTELSWLMNFQRSAGGAGWETVQLVTFSEEGILRLPGFPPLHCQLKATSVPCEACGSDAPPTRRCSRCRSVIYCSTACQREHWKNEHKHVCDQSLADDADEVLPGQVLQISDFPDHFVTRSPDWEWIIENENASYSA